MGIKLGSIVFILMAFFIAKITFEAAVTDKAPETQVVSSQRMPASIDESYNDYLARR
jgi:hypothetical protein